MKRICVIIPIFNEEKAIGSLVKELKAMGLDVVAIDDGSTDNSPRLVENAGAYLLRNTNRSGKGYSLKRGFQYAIENNFDGVVCMDGDGQHAPEDIKGFIDLAQIKNDCVINGNRLPNASNMPAVRYWTNRLMSALISFACGQSIADTQCGYRYISTAILRQVELKTDAFEIETEILIRSAKKGFQIYSVPVQTIYGDEISHINPLRDTVRFIQYFIKELFRS